MIDKNKVSGYMKMKGINAIDLAKKLGMAKNTFYRKLNDGNEWKFNEVWELTQHLDVEFNDLLKKEEK